MADVLRAVSHPSRTRIVELVWDSELTSREIAGHFDLTWQAVSHNLKVLREAGVLTERRDGNRRLYRVDRAALGSLEPVLREMWTGGMRLLGRAAEREAAERDHARSDVTTERARRGAKHRTGR